MIASMPATTWREMAHPSALDAEDMKGFRIAPHHPAELAAPSVWAPLEEARRASGFSMP
jgi:hypothetical protein